MKNKLKFLIVALTIVFVIPQITLAAWWNPFSWNIWNIFNIFSKPQTSIVHPKESQTAGKFIYPNGGENFIIGESQKIIWQMPGSKNTYYTLTLDLINEQGEELGSIINWNYVKYDPIDSVKWDFKTIYTNTPSGKTPEGQTVYELKPNGNLKIQPGNYKLRLQYNHTNQGGTQGSFESNYFKTTSQIAGSPAEASATEGWKVFTNDLYGYQISYPLN